MDNSTLKTKLREIEDELHEKQKKIRDLESDM
jgi:hypothetical protein